MAAHRAQQATSPFDEFQTPSERKANRQRIETRARTRDLKSEWIAWASRFTWDWFVTLTWSPNRTPSIDRVGRDVGIWANVLCRRQWGRRFYRRGEGLFGFVIPERHADGRWHVHGLIGGAEDLSTTVAERLWERRWGRAKIDDFEDSRGLDYVFKHAVWVGEPIVLGATRDD